MLQSWGVETTESEVCNQRSHHSEKPAHLDEEKPLHLDEEKPLHLDEEKPLLVASRKKPAQQQRPNTSKNKKF